MCHAQTPTGPQPRARTREVEIPLRGGERMPAVLSSPADDVGAAAPPVLVIPDMFGRSPFYERLAGRLAEAGFAALLVDYFFRLDPLAELSHEAGFERRRQLDESRSIEDLRASIAWLRAEHGCGARVGTIGFCMGGTFALDLTALEPGLATVAFYGFPVPQATLASPPAAPLHLAQQLRGPILALWGARDEVVGKENVATFVARMEEAEEVEFEHRVYPGLGHGFLAAADDPDASEETCAAVTDAWHATLAHLGRQLG
ncbi:MAG TPA: dienelactone hydrolase family protein [Solirubrobacterales bacterium]|nr:dienelactone hydrolase family protein [Solirubrobacterales bacterium]